MCKLVIICDRRKSWVEKEELKTLQNSIAKTVL